MRVQKCKQYAMQYIQKQSRQPTQSIWLTKRYSMTRAKDISKIITDADFSGTLDVTGTVTAGGLTVDGDVLFTQTTNLISTDTSDGADNKRLFIAGGASPSADRGGLIGFYGN